MSDAKATNLTPSKSIIASAIIEGIIWKMVELNFPELKHCLLNANK